MNGLLFITALAITLAAAAWLGNRFYLHKYGVMTQGQVTKSSVKTSRISTGEFSASERSYTRYLTIQYTGPDGVKRTVEGTHYSSEEDEHSQDILRVGGTAPVLYSKGNPGNAVYFDRRWHYIVPVALLLLGIPFVTLSGGLCYNDIRIMNRLSVAGWNERDLERYQDAIIENSDALYRNRNDATAYEQRGDAQFATVQFSEAVADYSEALRLLPDRRELLLKRAKAHWLDGHDYDALRDWLSSR